MELRTKQADVTISPADEMFPDENLDCLELRVSMYLHIINKSQQEHPAIAVCCYDNWVANTINLIVCLCSYKYWLIYSLVGVYPSFGPSMSVLLI